MIWGEISLVSFAFVFSIAFLETLCDDIARYTRKIYFFRLFFHWPAFFQLGAFCSSLMSATAVIIRRERVRLQNGRLFFRCRINLYRNFSTTMSPPHQRMSVLSSMVKSSCEILERNNTQREADQSAII